MLIPPGDSTELVQKFSFFSETILELSSGMFQGISSDITPGISGLIPSEIFPDFLKYFCGFLPGAFFSKNFLH